MRRDDCPARVPADGHRRTALFTTSSIGAPVTGSACHPFRHTLRPERSFVPHSCGLRTRLRRTRTGRNRTTSTLSMRAAISPFHIEVTTSTGRVARHRAGSRRDDDGRLGMPCRNLGINVVPVERAICGDGCDRTTNLVEQGADLRAVVAVVVGQLRRDDPAGASCSIAGRRSPATPRKGAEPS